MVYGFVRLLMYAVVWEEVVVSEGDHHHLQTFLSHQDICKAGTSYCNTTVLAESVKIDYNVWVRINDFYYFKLPIQLFWGCFLVAVVYILLLLLTSYCCCVVFLLLLCSNILWSLDLNMIPSWIQLSFLVVVY